MRHYKCSWLESHSTRFALRQPAAINRSSRLSRLGSRKTKDLKEVKNAKKEMQATKTVLDKLQLVLKKLARAKKSLKKAKNDGKKKIKSAAKVNEGVAWQ